MFKSIFVALILTAFASPGFAQSTPRVDKRQDQQDQLIDKGAASGQLNKKEIKRLEKGQTHVQKMETKAMADGKVTKHEQRRLEHAQDVQEKHIARESKDKQKTKKQ